VTTSRQQQAKLELERRRTAVLQATHRAEAELAGLRAAERSHEFEEVAQTEQSGAELSRLSEAERHELLRIEAALTRIDEGRWGICAECGQAIEPRRLEVLPWAIRCAGCAEAAEASETAKAAKAAKTAEAAERGAKAV
jgi:RNA polymerase-binding transcription factor DksA